MLPIILEEQIRTELALPPQKVVLEGWVTPEQGINMAELIISEKPDVIVEIGVFGGRSLIAQALALRENNKGRIYGIDPWKVDAALEGENQDNQKWWRGVDMHAIHRGCVEAIWRLNLDKYVRIIRSSSQECYVMFKGGEMRPDILFIDGNHSEIASCRDVQIYMNLVRPGGWIWMDDCNWPSTAAAQKMVLRDCAIRKDYGSYKLFQKSGGKFTPKTDTISVAPMR